MKVKLHRGGRIFGPWLELIVGRYRIDAYWEPINGWRRFIVRWPLTARIGPLLIIGQNWRRKQPHYTGGDQ